MIKHIKVKLDDLYKDVEIASDVLEYMEVLPDVGEVAAEIRKVVDKFKDSLKTPKKAMDKLEHGTRDIRTIVKDIDNRSKAVKDDIKRFQKEESFSLSDLCDAMRCISSIPPGSVQDDLIESLEEFSVDANVIVEDANKKQDELLKYANEGNNLISDVEREFRKLTHMDHVIDDVRDVLDPLFHILKKVEHELDKEVKIEEHLLFVEITLFEFRIKDVLRGIDDIAHWVMKELNKLAEDVLRPVFDDLHLHHFLNHFMHFKLPNIPYLNYIKFIEDEIRDYFDAFDTKLRHLVDKIENRIYKDIEPVAEEMKKLKKTYEQCK